eukprot:5786771-Prymnesium_polylepis.1
MPPTGMPLTGMPPRGCHINRDAATGMPHPRPVGLCRCQRLPLPAAASMRQLAVPAASSASSFQCLGRQCLGRQCGGFHCQRLPLPRLLVPAAPGSSRSGQYARQRAIRRQAT